MTYKEDNFTKEKNFRTGIIRMHEIDDNKHALQWFINDIIELKDKYCLDNERVKEMIEKHTDIGHHFSSEECECTSCMIIKGLGL